MLTAAKSRRSGPVMVATRRCRGSVSDRERVAGWRTLDRVELVSGPWRVQSARLARGDDRPREYLSVYFHGYHVADVRTVDELGRVLAAHGLALSDLVTRDAAHLR
jgi:hypothetical protein